MDPGNDSVSVLQDEISQWEHAINCYNGSDPLDLWFRYICWLETHPRLEGKFRKSVEQCLSSYDKYENYKQDIRMVKLWIKYIDFQPNPLNLYKILYQQGIGTRCAAFYIGWAHYYNSANHFKQAESIYNLGLQLKADPAHELESAQKNFRFSVAQRMLYNDESSKKRTISSLEEQRQQITSLSPHQNQPNAKRMRTNSHDYTHSNTLPIQTSFNGHSSQNQQQIQQHQPQQQYSAAPNLDYNGYSIGYAIGSSLVYENSNIYPQIPEQKQGSLGFTYECGFQMPLDFINYARNSHELWNVNLFLEEPFDPNRRCFYPKHLVYPGDGLEYSLEELKCNKWRLKLEEKRRQEELQIQRQIEEKRLYQEQEALRARQEQERIRIEQERQKLNLRRIREEQERVRIEQDTQRIKMEQKQREEAEHLRLQHEMEQRNQERYSNSKLYQIPQQGWSYNMNDSSPANYGAYYNHSYENSPQYSYAHDHQYQTHYSQSHFYQSSPQGYQNSPNYHQQQSVIVNNRNQYDNHQYYQNYTHSPGHSQQHLYNYHRPQQQIVSHPNQILNQNEHKIELQQQKHSEQQHTQQMQQQQRNSQKYEESNYQDVEYLIDHQAEIDPSMLQQPIVESYKKNNRESDEDQIESEFEEKRDENSDESFENEDNEDDDDDDDEEEDEQLPTIVNSYMLDDLEEQIEASTISFSSNGKSRDKKITIKFRKEKTSTTVINSESNSESSSAQAQTKVPLESKSLASSKKKKNRSEVVTSYDGENTQFMPSSTNSCSSTVNNGEVNATFGKTTFNGCVTPARKAASSKTSTPISSYKFLKNRISNQNDDSICSSYNVDQNSFFQAENDEDFKSRRIENALETIEEHMKKRDVDPFNTELCRAFLVKLNFPNRENTADYKVTNVNLPKLTKNQTVPIGGLSYQIEKEVGRGSYGAVYRGVNCFDGSAVALKYQRPSNLATWELYICTEVKKRIKNPDILPGFMTISAAVIAPNASVLISEFSQFGSLLDINNRIRQATTKVMHESLAMHFSSQILSIVAHLHDCKVIHADIKPDNFLLMTLPSADTHIPSLRLIDFGCAIDMALFKKGQEFRKIIETDGFTCVEMQEGRLWSYQTDLFCVAGTIHVMLFGEYMQVNKKFGVWDIKQKFPRYLNKSLWTDVFSKLLNIKDNNNLPSLRQLKVNIDREINDNDLIKNIRTVSNLIRKR